MKHKITEEHLATVHFEKVLASETDSRRGETKSLTMHIAVKHIIFNLTYATYCVKYHNYRNGKGSESVTGSIYEAVDEYNSI